MQQWMSGFAQNGVQRIVDVTGSGQCGSVGVLGMNIVGTRVRTDIGWCPVETLGAGDLVQTFNRGPQSIFRADRVILWAGGDDCPRRFWPLVVPEDVLGNDESIRLMPQQRIALEPDLAEDLFGDRRAIVPTLALEGIRGIRRVRPTAPIVVVALRFDANQQETPLDPFIHQDREVSPFALRSLKGTRAA